MPQNSCFSGLKPLLGFALVGLLPEKAVLSYVLRLLTNGYMREQLLNL